MSTRSTRSRSARITTSEESQTKIRDVFKVTRNRGKQDVNKKTITEAPSESTVDKPVVRGKTLKRIKTEHESTVINASVANVQDGNSKAQLEAVLAPIEHVVPDSPPGRARKTPTPTSSPTSNGKSVARKALFATEAVSSTVEQPASVPMSSEASAVECPVKTRSRKLPPKMKTVAELQATLAEKGALRRIHQQNITSKSRQVEEHVQLLKSPQKKVPMGKVCLPPAKQRQTSKTLTQDTIGAKDRELPVPKYVLPSFKTPQKEPDSDDEREQQEKRRIFDYGKAALLIPQVKENADLPLPAKYQSLLDSFQNCDRIMSIYANQGRRCVLSEIRKNVQKNTKRDFSMSHVAQVVDVYPTSYHIRLEEQWQAFGGTIAGKYEHVIAVNLTDDLTNYMLPHSPTKAVEKSEIPLVTPGKCLSPMKSPRKKCQPLPRAPEIDVRARLEGWRMVCRSHVMRHLLVEKVKMCYRQFMDKIEAPLVGSSIRRFHPKFLVKIETECPELSQAYLPEPPRRDETLRNMRDFMDSVDTTPALPTAVDIALKELKSPVKSAISSTGLPLSPKKFAQLQANKPKGTMSLLERIRAKEAARRVADESRDPEAERRRCLLQRLSQGMLRTLLAMYTQRQCRSMDLNTVVDKIVYSSGSKMTRAEVSSHLEILCEVASSFCSMKDVVGRKYLQISDPNYQQISSIVKSAAENVQPSVISSGSQLLVRSR